MNKLTETVNTFDKYAKPYQEKFAAFEPYVKTYEKLSALIEDRASILDVACGPANISHYLLGRHPRLRVHGTDLAPAMLSLARAAVPSGFFELRDSRDIVSIGKCFDALIAGFCVPYLDKGEVEKFVSDARSMLRAGGIFYLSTMSGDYADSGCREPDREDRVYTYFYREEFLQDLLIRNGFEILELERKTYVQEDSAETTDLFFYVKVV
tara:strand:- start:253 stop:882 length:630 start_codon:yes stop_codon:yes gene_type:complete